MLMSGLRWSRLARSCCSSSWAVGRRAPRRIRWIHCSARMLPPRSLLRRSVVRPASQPGRCWWRTRSASAAATPSHDLSRT